MKLRINEAIEQAKKNGKKVTKIQIARLLWPDSSQRSQTTNIQNLCTGKTKTIQPEWLVIISKELGCTIDDLVRE